jgi:hypothetical protein
VYTLPRQPGSIGQVLDAAVMLFKSSFLYVLPFTIVGGGVALVPNAFLLFYDPVQDTAALGQLLRGGLYWTVFFASVIVAVLFTAAGMARAESVAQGNPISVGAALAIGLRRFPVVVLSLLCFVVAVCVGFVLLVIPGMILMVSLILYTPAIVVDRKGIIEALTYSHSLVWGNWWRTSVLFTVGLVVVYVLFIIIAAALGMLSEILGLERTTLMLLQFITNGLVALVTTPFANALLLEIYRDLKLRKEGGDLEQRLGALQPASV